ncbi:MAG: class I SAM-dependent methyltransferase [Thermodesulfobacteriota bacterium]
MSVSLWTGTVLRLGACCRTALRLLTRRGTDRIDYHELQQTILDRLLARRGYDAGMLRYVGTGCEAMGEAEKNVLVHFGLHRDSYLIDVGCGAGRLGTALAGFLKGGYLGLDILDPVLRYAEDRCRAAGCPPTWRFRHISSGRIPEHDATVDMVCFFSVFTHILHQDCFDYLKEAKRVLRTGGKIVFSFLEYGAHWDVFLDSFTFRGPGQLTVFFHGDDIRTWSEHLGLRVEAILTGPDIRLDSESHGEPGLSGGPSQIVPLGQSLAVLALD